MVMIFVVKEAREQLLCNGVVVTFRENPHTLGKDWVTDKRGGKKLCDVQISELKINDDAPCDPPVWIRDIEPYWGLSGFKSIEGWFSVIQKLTEHSKRFNGFGYLYLISVVSNSTEPPK
jgi:hypothetical protein